MSLPETFSSLLAFLMSPIGALLVVNLFSSWFLEKWDKWEKWDNPQGKKYVTFALSLTVAGLSYLLLQYPDLLEAIEPVYEFVVIFATGWLALDGGHKLNKLAAKYSENK